jgi:uncharacterized protein YndB with AHSA1/START domain
MSCVTRETLLPIGPDEVWDALTDPELLEEWLAEEVELDPVEGGEVSARDADGSERNGTVETVIERERLAFTWERDGEGPTHVEFVVEELPAGTRLVVTETLTGPTALASAGPRWDRRLLSLGRAALLVRA